MDALCAATNSSEHDDSITAASSTSDEPSASLFQEIDEAVNICTLTYTLTMLRRLVQEGKITDRTEEIMHLPMSLQEANELVLEQRHHLTLSKYSDNKRIFTNIVKTLSDRQYYQSHPPPCSPRSPLSPSRRMSSRSDSRSSSSRSSSLDRPPRTVHVSSSFLTAFGGETSQTGLVFAIGVNIDRKIVTLCFRGAETDVDWAPLNTDVYMKEIVNPMKRHASQSSSVKIHNQLHDLLIRTNLKASDSDWDAISNYSEILEEYVIPALIENPGFKVHYCD